MWQIGLNALAIMAVLYLLAREFRAASRQQAGMAGRVFELLAPHLRGARIATQQAAGTEKLTGWIDGHFVDIRTVTDTLALRKLPSLWLMITLPGETGVHASLDLMMRAAGLASFSNFDRLADTLPSPPGFPEDALLKSDAATAAPAAELLRPLMEAFLQARGKEILITPKGVRMVIQISEAERARYGVFRQAKFAATALQPDHILPLVDLLTDLKLRLQPAHAANSDDDGNDHDDNNDGEPTFPKSLAHG